MVTAPTIRAAERIPIEAGSQIRLALDVPKDLHYFDGHFPGCALLPGVVQLTWAVELAREYLKIVGVFRGISALKFMRVIQPGDSISLALSFVPSTGRLEFEYEHGADVCASGVVQFES